jgi:hypothetical protein
MAEKTRISINGCGQEDHCGLVRRRASKTSNCMLHILDTLAFLQGDLRLPIELWADK